MELEFWAYDTQAKRLFSIYGLGKDWCTEDTMNGVDPGVNAFDGDDFKRLKIIQFTGLLTENEEKVLADYHIIRLHLFTQELGYNLGVTEGEVQFTGVISSGELGLIFTHGPGEDDWFYLVYAPGMLHETSYTIIGNIYETPELLS